MFARDTSTASCSPTGGAARKFGESRPVSAFGEGIFQRRTLGSEQLRAVFSHVHVVFQANAEFSPDVNPRLVAGGHVGLEFGLVAAHQVGPLVSVHAHSVAQT